MWRTAPGSSHPYRETVQRSLGLVLAHHCARHHTPHRLGRLWQRIVPSRPDLGVKITVYEYGLRYQKGRHAQDVRWEELHSIAVEVRPAVRLLRPREERRYTVRTPRGDCLVFTSELEDFEALRLTLEKQLLEQHLPRLMASFEAGQQLRFGGFSLDRRRLRRHGCEIAWTLVDGVTLEGDSVVVRERGQRWAVVPCREVTDLVLFLAVSTQAAGRLSAMARGVLNRMR